MMKVSIVIPTRERCEYIKDSIRTALAIEDPNIEVVVHDNFSQDGTREVVGAFDDPRLKYFNTNRRISMRANYNEAILNSTGDYLIFFGDDDGIIPGQFPYLRNMLEVHKPDGVSWAKINYTWPEDPADKKAGGLRLRKQSLFGEPKFYDPKERNLGFLMNARVRNFENVRPNLYHGCVSRNYLDRIAVDKHVYLNGVIPDINFTYRAILEGGRYIHMDHLFTVNGIAKKSTGAGHRGHNSQDTRADPAKAFEAENEADPYNDLLEHARFVPLALFATLETARLRIDYSEARPNFESWYRFVAGEAKKRVHPYENVVGILRKYAETNGTEEILEGALMGSLTPKRTAKENLNRAMDVLNSKRVRAGDESENTIFTAALCCDELLGEMYGQVLSKSLSRTAAWKGLKRLA